MPTAVKLCTNCRYEQLVDGGLPLCLHSSNLDEGTGHALTTARYMRRPTHGCGTGAVLHEPRDVIQLIDNLTHGDIRGLAEDMRTTG